MLLFSGSGLNLDLNLLSFPRNSFWRSPTETQVPEKSPGREVFPF
jgi:hypothetical protein